VVIQLQMEGLSPPPLDFKTRPSQTQRCCDGWEEEQLQCLMNK